MYYFIKILIITIFLAVRPLSWFITQIITTAKRGGFFVP